MTTYIVEPKLGPYDPKQLDPDAEPVSMAPLESRERRALLWAGVAALAVAGLIAALAVPHDGALRLPGVDDTLGSLRPFLTGIVVLVAAFFAVSGIVYGALTGTIRNDRDVINAMAKSMGTLSLYIVLVFFAAQRVLQLDPVGPGDGGSRLDRAAVDRLTGPPVFLAFIALCGLINLSLGSASAQWAVTPRRSSCRC